MTLLLCWSLNRLWAFVSTAVLSFIWLDTPLCLFAAGRYKLQSCGVQTASFFSESDSSRMRLVRGPLSCCLSLGPCWGGGCGQRLPDRLAQHRPYDPPLFFSLLLLINFFGAAHICRVWKCSLSVWRCREKRTLCNRTCSTFSCQMTRPPHHQHLLLLRLCPPTSVETLLGPKTSWKRLGKNLQKRAHGGGRLGPDAF